VEFNYRPPHSDTRPESCHVFEDSIVVDSKLPDPERARLLEPIVVGSAKDAMHAGHSLALIRPRETKFTYRPKSRTEIEDEREAYRRAARQGSFLDKELAELEPSPYQFRFQFEDAGGVHDYENGDWETHATFWRWRDEYGDEGTLRRMSDQYNDEYPTRGMAFAIGNQAKRRQTRQLLGVIRLDEERQGELFTVPPPMNRDRKAS
jgi:hypothetical protein